MPKLFISHASEDKDAFARPLAESLRSLGFEVWFDEYELKIGDSLRDRIDQGLKTCDYGVVILSPNFFAKKWPRSELDGLLALEEVNRKIILPVWLNVAQDDVQNFSPLLAGRLAASGENGVNSVVNEINKAISDSSRAFEVAKSPVGKNALKSIGAALESKEAERNALFSVEGANQVVAAYEELCALLKTEAEAANGGLKKARFIAKGTPAHGVSVEGPFRVMASLVLTHMAINSAAQAQLIVRHAVGEESEMGQFKFNVREQSSLVPRLIGGTSLRWAAALNYEKVFTSSEVVDAILFDLAQNIEEERKRHHVR